MSAAVAAGLAIAVPAVADALLTGAGRAAASGALSPIAALTGGALSSGLGSFLSSRCIADTPMSRIAVTTLLSTGV